MLIRIYYKSMFDFDAYLVGFAGSRDVWSAVDLGGDGAVLERLVAVVV
jgi:hypothetical protein